MRELKIQQSITVRSQSLDAYLKLISNEQMIGTDEEVALAERIHKGDQRALDKLVRANLRFVVSIAKQYQNRGLDLMDLIDEGNIGLIEAAQRFDETRGFKFISYAVWWIRQHILLALSEQASIIRQPLNHINNISRINQAFAKFEQEHNRTPSVSELSEMTDIKEDKVLSALNSSFRTRSIDAPFAEDDDNSLADVLSDSSAPSVDSELMAESLKHEIDSMLNQLNPRDKRIICMCYGIGSNEYTLDEIGAQFHLSRERVRQIKERSIRHLRTTPHSRILRNYL